MSKAITFAAAIAGLFLFSASSWSIPITPGQNGVGMVNLGGAGGANPEDEKAYLNLAIQVWNGALAPGMHDGNDYTKLSGTSVPSLLDYPYTGTPWQSPSLPGDLTSLDIDLRSTDYLYLVTKIGNEETIYYIGEIESEITVTSSKGLSHYTLFPGKPSVPDAASTLMLLGIGISAVMWFVRSNR